MEKFEYQVDMHINVWQRTGLTVKAETKAEADAQVIALVEETPLSLDNGNENIETGGVEYLCETESLIDSTTETPTVEVYDMDCKIHKTEYALHTNLKKETVATIEEDFQQIIKVRESYNSQLSSILTRILQQWTFPVILAKVNDEPDDAKDVVVACSGWGGGYNARVLSVWLSGETICMKVENMECGDVINIDETDLEDDGFYFIINRILNPITPEA